MNRRVAIVGTTTWGTTLSIVLARNNYSATLVARTAAEAKELNSRREHRRFLPSIPFPDALAVSDDVAGTIGQSRLVIIAVPSHRFRQNVQWIKAHLPPEARVLSATKGLELSTSQRMSQVLEEELPPQLHSGICVLSGPNLAKEIAQGKPASTTIAGKDMNTVTSVQETLMSPLFRVYTSEDVVGVELGGALKNIIALGAGFADGLEIGDNTKAAFITRGVVEITRLGIAAGAQPLTFAGLAGLGDIVATCASNLSRNRYVGEQLARGKTWPEIRDAMDNVAEGVNTTEAALQMANRLGVEMPITQVTHRVLFEGLPPHQAIQELMERPPRSEW